jgi:hypothetical protein
MTIAIVDHLFDEAELKPLEIGKSQLRKVDERAPDNILQALWPVEGTRPSSSISLKIARDEQDDDDPLGRTAKKIANACFPTAEWIICNARYFHYLPGEQVVKHVDGKDKVMAAILYLTHHWEPGYGGELEVEFEGQSLAIAPKRGRVVVVGPDVVHGSNKVLNGERDAIVFFYTQLAA